MREADDRVDHDSGDDHDEVHAEHDRHGRTLSVLPDALGRRAQRLEPFGERDVSLLRMRLGLRLAVAPREERLAEAGKRALSLGEVGRMPVETFGRLRLALGFAPQLALPGLELLLFRRNRALAGLELGERRFAVGQLLFAPIELGRSLVETDLRLRDPCAGRVDLRGLSVELGLPCPKVRFSAIELGAFGFELG
jgi:hypothetical protein